MKKVPLIRQYIPQLSQNLFLDCASTPIFAAASIGHVLEHGLLPQRLGLPQIWGCWLCPKINFETITV